MLLALFAVLFLSAVSSKAEVIDRIIAVVNGRVITLSELKEQEAPVAKQISESFSGEERDKRLFDLRKRVMDSLIEDVLLEQEADKSGMKVSEKDIDDAIDEVKKQNKLDDSGLRSALVREGLTYDAYRAQLKKQIEKSRVIAQQVRSRVSVTDKELKDYYEQNKRQFTRDEEIKVSQILFPITENASDEDIERIKGQALDVLEMVRKGKDFSELARTYSRDASAMEGGSLGFFKKGQLLPAFEAAVLPLKKGEVSNIVKTRFGFHIIRLDDIIEASPEPFESVKEKIRSSLTSEMMETRYKEWMEELKKSAIIEIK